MSETSINLPDALCHYAVTQVAAGRFSTIQDFVVALVSADERSQQVVEKLSNHSALVAMLEEGLQSADGRQWSPAVLHELKQEVLDRTAGKIS